MFTDDNYILQKPITVKHNHSSKVCPVERAGALDTRFRKIIHNPVKILSPFIKPGNKVLELGCGPGYFTIEMARLVGAEGLVYACDIQEGMLDIVRKKIELAQMYNRVHVHKCDESGLNLKDTVDFIFAFYVIHEVADQVKLFDEFRKILNPGGKILIVEPAFHVTKNEFQVMLLKLENKGFRITDRPSFFLSHSAVLG
jgi:ubiquinone/menaquinone biosynthesis C-methylase UbiE